MNILFDNLETLIDAQNGIEKTRELILQLAVQGKLVEQDPSDEPASELLKKIKKEKEKLIAEGKIKKQNEFPPIKEEEKPFELPKGWEWVRLDNIGMINPRNDISDDLKVSFIPMSLISERYGVNAKCEIKSWGEIKKGFTHFAEDDVGLAKITPCFENGKAAVFRNLTNGYGAGTTELHIFRKITNGISSDFIYILIKSPSFVEGGKSQMTGTAGQQRVSKDYFQNFIFALPPSNEQKRIVEKVNSLMALLDELEEKKERRNQKRIKLNNASLEKLLTSKDDTEQKANWERIEENFTTLYSVPENVEKLKQAILQLAVQGKLVEQDPTDEPAPELLKKIKKEKNKLIAEDKIKKQKELPPIKDEEKPFELPKGWEWVRNGELLNELLGGFSFKSNSFLKNGKNQVIRLGNIRPGRLRLYENPVFISDELAAETKNSSLRENDILITMTGTKGKRDYCYTVKLQENTFENRNLFLNQRVGCFRYNRLLDISFLDIVLKNDLILDLMYASSTGTANQANIGVTILNEILIPIPPINEQKRIVEKVNELMSLCNALVEKLTKKEEEGERLVRAVVSKVSNNTKKPKEDKEALIKDLINKHNKALTKLS